jgi:hypothetical protein
MAKYEARESPVRVLGYLSIRRGSVGPQKPFSWLSEGVKGVFTINTEIGEKTCALHLHILGAPPCPRSRWCELLARESKQRVQTNREQAEHAVHTNFV